MTSVAEPREAPRTSVLRRVLLLLPLAVFLGLAGLFLLRLGAGDPSIVPSALIGRPAPAIDLPPLAGVPVPGLSSADLAAGHVTVLNVFASWCAECHQEHPALTALAQDPAFEATGASLAGLVYKDDPDNARRYLGAKGNPFARLGTDRSGRAGIDFGVYGVPETFVIRGDGVIAYKLVGALTAENRPALMAAIAAALPFSRHAGEGGTAKP